MIVKTPQTPYVAVIFTSLKNEVTAKDDYDLMNALTEAESNKIEGYIGCESTRMDDGWGITVSYWTNMDAVKQWQKNTVHQQAKQKGRSLWYHQYSIRICEVMKDGISLEHGSNKPL